MPSGNMRVIPRQGHFGTAFGHAWRWLLLGAKKQLSPRKVVGACCDDDDDDDDDDDEDEEEEDDDDEDE